MFVELESYTMKTEFPIIKKKQTFHSKFVSQCVTSQKEIITAHVAMELTTTTY